MRPQYQAWRARGVMLPAMAVSLAAIPFLKDSRGNTSAFPSHWKNQLPWLPSRAVTRLEASSEDSTNLGSWKSRWTDNRIGFHREHVNPNLVRYLDSYLLKNNKNVRVLVPLCGKTVDMAYLAKDDRVETVVGVEGIRKALEEFAAEQPDLQVRESNNSSRWSTFDKWVGEKIILLKGDFFQLNPKEAAGKFEAIWDRASLVAVQPSDREKYVQIIGDVIAPGGTILLSTLVRANEDLASGPPFSIGMEEVQRLFGTKDWVESIEALPSTDDVRRPWYYSIVSLFRDKSNDRIVKVFVIKAKRSG